MGLIVVTWPKPRLSTNEEWRISRCIRELSRFKDEDGKGVEFIVHRGFVELSDSDGMRLASRLETAGIKCDLFDK